MTSTDVEGFSAEFFDGLAAVEERHFWFRGRNALIGWALSRYFPNASTFLEVGCGNGQVAAAMQRMNPALRITASEAFVEGLSIAGRRMPDADLVQADARQLPWDDEFDVVGAFDVLEHIVDDAGAARQLARAARRGGGVIVTVPQHQWLWSPIDEYSGHQRRYTRSGLVNLLERAGLHVERLTSFVSLLLPVLALTRGARRDARDPMAEFRISPGANGVGAAAMRLELALIRAGVSLPAGGSLLAVARRPA